MATSFSPSRRLLIILFSLSLLLGTRDYAAGWEYRGIELVVTYWIEYWTSQLHCTRPFLLFYAPRAGVGKVQQYSRYLFQLAVGRWPLIVFCQFIYSLEICIPFATLGYEPTSDQPIELHSRNENINPGWTIDNSSSCQCTCSLPLHCTALCLKGELHYVLRGRQLAEDGVEGVKTQGTNKQQRVCGYLSKGHCTENKINVVVFCAKSSELIAICNPPVLTEIGARHSLELHTIWPWWVNLVNDDDNDNMRIKWLASLLLDILRNVTPDGHILSTAIHWKRSIVLTILLPLVLLHTKIADNYPPTRYFSSM